MTTQSMTTDQAIRALRTAGYTVKPHGARYILGATHADNEILREDDLVNFAHTVLATTPRGAEAPAGWTAECGSCGQAFISDAPVADGAICPSCAGKAATDAPAPIIGALSNPNWPTLPMIDLYAALEAHARRLARLTPTTPIPIPAGVPDRLLVPIGCVVPGRYQPRQVFEQAALDELADSIREHGILNPLLVFANEKGDIELIAGERRLRASHQVGLVMVPVEFRAHTLMQIAEISGVDNMQRAQLSPIEEGRFFNRLISELGISEAGLAKRLGQNRAGIQQRRAIASAAPEVQAALESGALTFSQARAIALAAPGDTKAQKKGFQQVQTWIANGRRPTESDAKAATESAVLAEAGKKLEALGWTVAKPYGYTLIWAASEKPRPWTGAEILAAITAQTRPSGEPPTGTADAAQLKVLKQRYHVHADYKPWIGLSDGYSDTPTFYAPGALDAVVAQVQADLAEAAAKAAAHGWTLKATGEHHYELKHGDGAYHSIFGWVELQKTLAGLAKAKTTSGNNYTPPKKICGLCKKETTTYSFFEGDNYCDKPCFAKAKTTSDTRKQAARATVAAAIGPWLIAAPDGALRLLFDLCGWRSRSAIGMPTSSTRAAEARQIATLPAEQLARGIATVIAEQYDNAREHPIASFPAETPRNVVLTFSPDEVAIFPGQAERAIELLAADGYATIAEFVRVAAHALNPPPLTPSPTPDEETASDEPADDSPLGGIAAGVDELEDWAENLTMYDEEELQITQAEVRQIRADLEQLADAPDVSDEAYEALSSRLGVIEQAIKDALEAVPQ